MKNFTKTGFFISSKIGKAIGDYNLIEDGDRILVAVSGGKDSLTLLKLLRERERWLPAKFEIVVAHIETDLKCGYGVDKNFLIKIFKDLGLKYRFKKIKLLDKRDDINCFWCSWNRRKTLFKTAYKLGCNKVTLGHHKDDIIETTLLNLFFQGEISTMNPRQELFDTFGDPACTGSSQCQHLSIPHLRKSRQGGTIGVYECVDGKIVIIRPLCYVEEKTIKKFAKENGFLKNIEKSTKLQDSNRRYVKELIKDIKKRSPNVKTNIFKSITRVKSGYINLKIESS